MTNQENWEKAFSALENASEKFWEMWLVGLGSMSWTQEQVENMVKKYLEQRKLTREESVKLMEELMSQTNLYLGT
jgi:polyhydroxyalkanoate synthesis regulator phasin